MGVSLALNDLFYEQILAQLPKRWMSHALGAAAHIHVPRKFNKSLIRSFAKLYQINLGEMDKPVEEYKSLGEFFSRSLKPEVRPIEGELIHPCDGTLIESGLIHNDVLIQAKSKYYKLRQFVPENPWTEDFQEGSFFTYYLSPQDYHRVHSPLAGDIRWSTLVPGELWPVNSWSVNNIDGLYTVNERVAAGIETDVGKVIVVMVGATNVGRMSFTFDPNIQTNKRNKKSVVHRRYNESRKIQVGDEFGVFHLGSTVVVLFDKNWPFNHITRQKVLMGQKFNG